MNNIKTEVETHLKTISGWNEPDKYFQVLDIFGDTEEVDQILSLLVKYDPTGLLS